MQISGLQSAQSLLRWKTKEVSLVALAVAMAYAAPAAADSCSDLMTTLSLPNTTITLAQSYTAGSIVSGAVKAPVDLCRVAGTVKPGPKSNVRFEVWIPTAANWNGKYQQVGNGGFAGSIPLGAIANATSRGYAAAGTDDGTSGSPPAVPAGGPAFIGNADVLLDYGYRAIKATTDDSKAIINQLMGSAPTYSYFVGCSDGGREALKEAQVFPSDFDGIIVGSPVNDQVGEFGSSYLYDMQATLTGRRPAAFLTRTSRRASCHCSQTRPWPNAWGKTAVSRPTPS